LSRFHKASIRDAEVSNRRVLARVDFNVPVEAGHIQDDARIRATLPTIELLRQRGASVVLVSHLGRPQDREPELSLAPVADRLAELVSSPVGMAPGVVGPDVEREAEDLKAGELMLLENVRYEPGETKNDSALAEQLARLGELYVEDAFGACHRMHASTVRVAEHLPAYAGLLLEREVETLTAVRDDPKRPLVMVLGGAKVSDKIGLIERFLDSADRILIGGAMSFSFFRAQGHSTGDSLVEEEGVESARRVLERAESADCELTLPQDLVLGDRLDADAEPRESDGVDVPDGWMGLDIGPRTAAAYAEAIGGAGTVFWNGPMGVFELEPFAAGTRTVAEAVAAAPGTTVVGGGDSAAALKGFGLETKVDWLSTGGGASLELLEGRPLPGVEVLMDA
jgi:phosphoglycerate kinase